ncbi:MAG: class I SAM-dependent methyltransferase [Phycisphaerae bacterium]|nr:class I SAM-dependent methyltransferase [Phycisphaerae bacterium]
MRMLATGALVSVMIAVSALIAVAESGGLGRQRGRWASDGDFRPPPLPMMTALDSDEDGTLSAKEIENAATALKQLDKDGDGELSANELMPRGGPFGGRDARRDPRGGAGRDRPGRGGQRGADRGPQGRTSADPVEAAPIPKTDEEKKILAVLEDMERSQRRGMMNVPAADGRLLRLLTEAVGAKTIVEIGTSNGYSGIWMCLALRTTGGKLITHEIDAQRAALARENFERAGVSDLVTLVEGDAHEEVKKIAGPIDLLFLDADKEGYIDYLEKLLGKVRPGGLIVAHNMNARQADPKYLEAITKNPALETLFVHMQGSGIGVTLRKR